MTTDSNMEPPEAHANARLALRR